MSARQCHAITMALAAVRKGATLSQAARSYGCNVRSVRRAVRRAEKTWTAALLPVSSILDQCEQASRSPTQEQTR